MHRTDKETPTAGKDSCLLHKNELFENGPEEVTESRSRVSFDWHLLARDKNSREQFDLETECFHSQIPLTSFTRSDTHPMEKLFSQRMTKSLAPEKSVRWATVTLTPDELNIHSRETSYSTKKQENQTFTYTWLKEWQRSICSLPGVSSMSAFPRRS